MANPTLSKGKEKGNVEVVPMTSLVKDEME